MRGYSVKATKWVDFVMTDSTRRESCHLLNVTGDGVEVKRLDCGIWFGAVVGYWGYRPLPLCFA
jgi:hypothetical protein